MGLSRSLNSVVARLILRGGDSAPQSRPETAEAGLSFRTVLARDILDLRRIGEKQYGDPGYCNKGIRGLLGYYREIGMI